MKTTLPKQFVVSLITFILSLIVFISSAQTVQTFTTSGSWVCPYGVTSVTVETWGGGGAGGAAPTNPSVGGGGGGGSYKITTSIPVAYGTSYNYIVGTGGLGNITGAGGNGTASSFNGSYTANFGLGGGSGTPAGALGNGGSGGNFNGGKGAGGTATASGAGGGGAGSSGNGGDATTTIAGTAGTGGGGAGGAGVTGNTNGLNGNTLGGGGSGAIRTGSGAKKGGDGANGQIRITYTINCTAPPTQPTNLILTPSINNIAGSFTAATYTDGYIVIRTSTAAAPISPVNGTTYTAGTSALGGYIESVGSATTFNSTTLAATTQYWYWVYGFNNVSCAGGINYLVASPLTGNSTTILCGSSTNTATITSLSTATFNSSQNTWNFNWSTLPWSLGHVPTSCENVLLIIDRTVATVAEDVSVNLDVNSSIQNFTMRNISNTAFRIVFVLSSSGAAKDLSINGNCIIECPGGSASNFYNRCSVLNNGVTTVNGDVILGRIPSLIASNEGQCSIGSGNTDIATYPNQILNFYGNFTFNPRGYTVDEHTVFNFNKVGTQYIYNNTRPSTSDTVQPVLFEDLRIGPTNVTNLIMGGTNFDGYIENVGRAGITIGVNSVLDMPANYSLNVIQGGLPSFLKMMAGAKLRLGGDQSTFDPGIRAGAIGGPRAPVNHGVPGSNFPGSFSPYVFDPTSTIEYYGSNSITQTIYNPPTYANLIATNGSGIGRAVKQTIAGTLKINTLFSINGLTDVFLGTATGLGTNTAPVTCNAPLNILATGGLYCNANVVSGTGAFSMSNGSYLGMGHVQGISNLGSATGNIQMTGGRTYNTTGNYIYNGILNQITGGGLPTTVNDLTIDNPTTVTIATNQIVNGTNLLKQGTFDIGSTKITINGPTGILNSVSATAKMKANLGIVEMKGTSGTAQNLSGSWFVNKTISSLINTNSTGIKVAAVPADTLLISSGLYYGAVTNSNIATNDNLTLLSRDTATATFGTITTGSSITGKVNIERYLPAKKSWRLLAAPVVNATAPTVTAAWREGGGPLLSTGYGTRITGPAGFIGVDEYTQRASMKYYSSGINNYVNVTNPNTTNISNTAGYYVFVRGDRGVPITGSAIPTILRIKGDIITGTQTVNVPAGKFVTFGNPYPSNVNLKTAAKTNISNTYYAWNPNSLGSYNVGAFENYTFDGTNYVKVPGGTIRNIIQSGEAIFIQSSGSAGTLTINETDKSGGTTSPVSKSSSARGAITKPTLEINLYTKDIDSSTYLADGILMNFNDDFSGAVDNDDVRKILNAGDNLFLKNDSVNLIVERRPTLKATDTIRLNLTGTRINPYRFEIDPSAIGIINLKAILKDRFLGSETLLSLSKITDYNFNITADPGSKAADRFMIVFEQEGAPMRFVKVAAARNKNSTVTVYWYTENENSINTYNIEYSRDGINFNVAGDQIPTANNNGNPYYSFVDAAPAVGNNWYRIKANTINGAAQYSDVAKIGGKEIFLPSKTSIYPNPITDRKVHVSFINEIPGKYQLMITNMAGQTVYREALQLENNSLNKTIGLKNVVSGNYQLIIKDEKGNAKKISFIVK